MASITIIPANQRGIAARIEGKLRERPGPADLQARAGYAARLFDKTEGQQAEHFRYLQAEARKVLRSVPVLEYVQQTRDLTQLANQSPSTVMGDGLSIAGLHRASRARLREANAYPPGLVDASPYAAGPSSCATR
jgi:hypothetical protein